MHSVWYIFNGKVSEILFVSTAKKCLTIHKGKNSYYVELLKMIFIKKCN